MRGCVGKNAESVFASGMGWETGKISPLETGYLRRKEAPRCRIVNTVGYTVSRDELEYCILQNTSDVRFYGTMFFFCLHTR